LEDTFQQFVQFSLQNQKNIESFIKNLEVHLGQLPKEMENC